MFDDKDTQNNNQGGGININKTDNPQISPGNAQARSFKNAGETNPPMEETRGNKPTVAAEKEAKKQVEDILAETDDLEPEARKPAAFQPKKPEVDAGEREQKSARSDNSGGKLKKIFVLLIIVCVLILFGVLGVWGYNKFVNQTKPAINPAINKEAAGNESEAGSAIDQTKKEEPAKKQPETPAVKPPVKVEALDTDKDGLSDEEEKSLGTDINNVDSDNDGLFDLEEVKVYKTNPLNADTDGDGFLDGAEVKDGYNPKGEGKLYEIGG